MGSTSGNKIEPYYDIPTVASILGYDHPQSLKNDLHLRRLDLSTFIVKGKLVVGKERSIGKTNALFVATLPYPPGVRQCRKAAEAAFSWLIGVVLGRPLTFRRSLFFAFLFIY